MGSTRSADFSFGLLHLLHFPFSLTLRGEHYGLGQYFGPIVLAFAPLFLLVRWKSSIAKVAGLVWASMFLLDVLTAQMGRFLLPVYAPALVLVFSGLASVAEKKYRVTVYGCVGTLAIFFAFAGASDSLYSRSFLPVVIGEETRGQFLNAMAPDYQYASFVNKTLRGSQDGRGRTLVFFRHLYYLRVPVLSGAPNTSWLMNPSKLHKPDALLRMLKQLDIKWVVRTPSYPPPLASAFKQLEKDKKLLSIATDELQSYTGNSRIYDEKNTVRVVILKVIQ